MWSNMRDWGEQKTFLNSKAIAKNFPDLSSLDVPAFVADVGFAVALQVPQQFIAECKEL